MADQETSSDSAEGTVINASSQWVEDTDTATSEEHTSELQSLA